MRNIKTALYFIIILVLFVSCAEPEDSIVEVNIISVLPVSLHDNHPVETPEQLNVKAVAVLDTAISSLNFVSTWEIEKIVMDVDDYSLKQSSVTVSEKSVSGFFIEQSSDGLTAYISLYEKGSYRVTYTLTDYNQFRTSSFIIKNGELYYPELFLSLNIFEDRNKKIDDLTGYVFVDVADDDRKDSLVIPASSIKNSWYPTGVGINPMMSFSITSGIQTFKKDNTTDIVLLPIEKVIKVTDEKGEVDDIRTQIDVEGKKLEVDKLSDDILIHSDIYSVLHYWIKGEKSDTYAFSNKTINEEFIPVFEAVDNPNAHSLKLFAGNIGVKYSNSPAFTYFSVDGLKNSFIDDSKSRRPFPTLPFGYLVGKLGSTGKPFPIGSFYNYHERLDLPVYYYDGEVFIEDK